MDIILVGTCCARKPEYTGETNLSDLVTTWPSDGTSQRWVDTIRSISGMIWLLWKVIVQCVFDKIKQMCFLVLSYYSKQEDIVFWDILALVNNWPNSPPSWIGENLPQVMQTQHIPVPVCLKCVFLQVVTDVGCIQYNTIVLW